MPSRQITVTIECTVEYVEERVCYGTDADGTRGDYWLEWIPTTVLIETAGLPPAVEAWAKTAALDEFESHPLAAE